MGTQKSNEIHPKNDTRKHKKKHENEGRKQHVFPASNFDDFERFLVPFLVSKRGSENSPKMKRKTEAGVAMMSNGVKRSKAE